MIAVSLEVLPGSSVPVTMDFGFSDVKTNYSTLSISAEEVHSWLGKWRCNRYGQCAFNSPISTIFVSSTQFAQPTDRSACSITDAVSDPEDTTQTYVEELLRMPGCFLCYTPMREPPPVAPAPCLMNGSVTFGSFNALAKITDEVIEVCFIAELT
jgi:hypothetical protein